MSSCAQGGLRRSEETQSSRTVAFKVEEEEEEEEEAEGWRSRSPAESPGVPRSPRRSHRATLDTA